MAKEYRLKELFLSRPNEWIRLPEIMKLGIAQYNRAISDLRAAGYNIENRTEWVDGERHSWFRYNTPCFVFNKDGQGVLVGCKV